MRQNPIRKIRSWTFNLGHDIQTNEAAYSDGRRTTAVHKTEAGLQDARGRAKLYSARIWL